MAGSVTSTCSMLGDGCGIASLSLTGLCAVSCDRALLCVCFSPTPRRAARHVLFAGRCLRLQRRALEGCADAGSSKSARPDADAAQLMYPRSCQTPTPQALSRRSRDLHEAAGTLVTGPWSRQPARERNVGGYGEGGVASTRARKSGRIRGGDCSRVLAPIILPWSMRVSATATRRLKPAAARGGVVGG